MMQLFSQYLMWSKKFEIWRKLRSSQTFATTFLKPQNGDFMSLLSWMSRVANKTHVIEKFLFYDIKSSKAMNNTTKNCVHSILMCLLSICNKKTNFHLYWPLTKCLLHYVAQMNPTLDEQLHKTIIANQQLLALTWACLVLFSTKLNW